jgi:hypothetical protein
VESRLVAERQILYQDVGKQHDKDGWFACGFARSECP